MAPLGDAIKKIGPYSKKGVGRNSFLRLFGHDSYMTGQSARRKGSHRDVRQDQRAYSAVVYLALTLIIKVNVE